MGSGLLKLGWPDAYSFGQIFGGKRQEVYAWQIGRLTLA
jgi:hypothetical protein